MALNSLGIGIVITVTGNYEQKLRSASNATRTFANLQKDLAKKAEAARQAALNQAIAFGVLSIRIGQVARFARNMFMGFTTGLGGMVKKAADFQTQASLLKVFFGDKSETLAGQLRLLSIETGSSIDDLVTVANRLGQIGLKASEAADATRLVAQAFKTLPAVEKTRALNSMGLAFQTTMSFNRAFNVVLDATEQKLFNAVSGASRVRVGMEALRKRFGNINDIMSGNLNFQLERMAALLDLLKINIVVPVLDIFTKALKKINLQLTSLFDVTDKNKKLFEDLTEIFKSIISPFTKLLEIIGELELIPKGLAFLAEHKEFVKTASAVFLLSSAFTALAGSLLAVSFATYGSIKVFQLTQGMSAIKGIGKGLAGFGTTLKLPKMSLGARGLSSGLKDFFSMRNRFGGGMAFLSLKETLRTTFTGGMVSAVLGFAKVLGILLIKFIAIAAIITFLAVLFRRAFEPLKEGLGSGINNIVNLAKGLFEVFTTGRIALKSLQQIENAGLKPLFEIIVTLGNIWKDFFKGIMVGSEFAGPAFTETMQAIKFAIIEITEVIHGLLVDFGFMTQESNSAAFGLGYTIGTLIEVIAKLISATFLAGSIIIRFLVAPFQIVLSVIKLVAAALAGLVSLISLVVGDFLGIPALEGLAMSSGEFGQKALASGLSTGGRGLTNLTGGNIDLTLNPGDIRLVLNNQTLAEGTQQWQSDQLARQGGAVR